jgi:hypothetical protein
LRNFAAFATFAVIIFPSGDFADRNGNISSLVPKFHIPVRFDNLVEGITSIRDWFDLPGFDERTNAIEAPGVQEQRGIVNRNELPFLG